MAGTVAVNWKDLQDDAHCINIIHDLDDDNFECALICLGRLNKDTLWPEMLRLVESRPGLLMTKFFFDYISTGLERGLTADQEKVFEVLLGRRLHLDLALRCVEATRHYIQSVFYYNHAGLMAHFSVRHYRLLSDSLNRISRLHQEDRITILRHTTELLTRDRLKATGQNGRHGDMLVTVIRRGLGAQEVQLTTHTDMTQFRAVTVFAIATRCRCVDLMRLFYKTGLVSSTELYWHRRLLDLRLEDMDMNNVDIKLLQCWDFVTRAAANPRPLRDLCVVRVSHHIGCCDDRTQRVQQLAVPESLKEEILFDDVLREFRTGVSSLHCRQKDPLGLNLVLSQLSSALQH